MKLKFAFLLFSVSFVLSNCNLNSEDKAIAFNDAIIDEQEKVIACVEAYNLEETFDLQVSLKLCEAISQQCDKSIKVLNALNTINGGESLKASVLAYFEFYKNVGKQEYVEYSNLVCSDDYTDEDYDKAIVIEEYINSETLALETKITQNQKVFAKKYNFRLN